MDQELTENRAPLDQANRSWLSHLFWGFLKVLLALYGVALLTSMAGMEMLSWSVFLLAVGWLGVRLFKRDGQILNDLKVGPDLFLWGFFVWISLSAIVHSSGPDEWIHIVGWLRWVLLLYAIAFVLKRVVKPSYFYYLLFFSLAVFAIGIYAAFQWRWGTLLFPKSIPLSEEWIYHRAYGFFNVPLTFAYSLGMAGVFLAGHLVAASPKTWFRNPYPVAYGLGFIGSIFCIAFSLTRGAWLAFAASTVFVLALVKPKLAAIVAAIGAAGVVIIALVSEVFRGRLLSIFSFSHQSNSLRLSIWRVNWEIFQDHWILGIGLGRNRTLIPEYYEKLGLTGTNVFNHAHNNLLQILVGGGLVGCLLYLGFCLSFLWESFSSYRRYLKTDPLRAGSCFGLLWAQVYFHVGGMTETSFTDGEVNHMLVAMWAVQVALSYQLRNKDAVAKVA